MLEAQEAARLLKALEDPDGAKRVERRIRELPEPAGKIAAAFLKTPQRAFNYTHDDSRESAAAARALESLGKKDRLQLFEAFHPALAPAIEAAWELQMRLPYQAHYLRKGFRAPNNPEATAPNRARWLSSLLAVTTRYPCDLEFFAVWGPYLPYGSEQMAGVLLAAALNGPESGAIFRILSDTVNGQHETARMGRHVTTALLCCSRPDGWALIENLLLAAQRQEGLRQVILETIDLAHPEAFRRMIRLIVDQKLSRFTATARAVAVWFGMPVDSAETKRIDELLAELARCLESADYRRQALSSHVGQSVYLALWSTAFEDAVAAIKATRPVLLDPQVERRYAAAHLLSQVGLASAAVALKDSLADPDLRVALAASEPFHRFSGEQLKAIGQTDLFERFEALIERTPKQRELQPIVWEWNKRLAEQARLTDALPNFRGGRPFSRLSTYAPLMSPPGRVGLLQLIGQNAKESSAFDPAEREIVIGLLGDASATVREQAFKVLEKVSIQPEEARSLEPLLSRKASDLRRGLIRLLLNQPEPSRSESILRLTNSKDALVRQAGLEMQGAIETAPEQQASLAHGLGLFHPSERTPPPAIRPGLPVELVTAGSKRLILSLDALVARHRETVVHWTGGDGTQHHEVLGNLRFFPWAKAGDALPMREVWQDWWRQRPSDLLDPDGFELLRSLVCRDTSSLSRSPEWQRRAAAQLFIDAELQYPNIVRGILNWLLSSPQPAGAPDFLLDAIEVTFSLIPPGTRVENRFLDDWRFQLGGWINVTGSFRRAHPALWTPAHWGRLWGLLRWRDEGMAGWPRQRPDLMAMIKAHGIGAATDADLYEHLLGASRDCLLRLTKRRPDDLMQEYPALSKFINRCRDRVLEVELVRGDLPTAASAPAMALSSIYGSQLALHILKALGAEPLARGWTRDNQSKTTVLSNLLRVCLPAENDTPENFQRQVNASGISEQRLVDLAVYAPQWAMWIEQATGLTGLEDAACWLHAHTKDRLWVVDAQIRELWYAQVSERTPLTEQTLLDGAVDVKWFHAMYGRLGSKRWATVLESAKYASGGAGHKRAELFAQALLGEITADALAGRIREKRHQDSLRALGLVPLPGGAKAARAELLKRYEVTQSFLKGSRKFGAQQQASEKLAVSIALDNLARTAGYPDAQRLSWAMEAEAIADLRKGAVEVTESGVTVRLEIDSLGDPQLTITKSGKELKDVPAALKKSAKIQGLRARKTRLTQQSSRMRLSLEESMVRGDAFTAAEIHDLLDHPLLKPRIAQLVFVNAAGELAYGSDLDGAKAGYRIAHPVDLLASGAWSKWQQECFTHSRQQPFKQIFRELYFLTQAEKQQKDHSSRYEGQQVNPRQAIALLGARGWVSVPEEGVRRTFHHDNLSAWVEFLEGFLTPAEVDGLTVARVIFTRRGESRRLDLESIPARIFSEAMRDIDLVVSVSHRGGVDPEATASTVEMRTALLVETLRLLKIGNVRLEGAHAFVDGKLAAYNVHLGSGVVHRQPGGSLCIIPVHSQHRGRLFLPFADDDPKTAEVVSKVLLLAKDEAIRDPTILEQLR